MTPGEPQSANDYDDRSTAGAKSVLIEIGQILGSFMGKFVIVGGAVPWLLLDNEDMRHVGTIDVDLVLDSVALSDGEYVNLLDALLRHGYKQGHSKIQLSRQIAPPDGGAPFNIYVDFLMPRDAEIVRNVPPLISNFAAQRADGADLAMRFHQRVQIVGSMPVGGTNSVEVAVCSIPALLAMKGHAIGKRLKHKDAYDIYYCVRNYPGGTEALAEECRPLLEYASGEIGYKFIDSKFDTVESFGPTCVRLFVEDTQELGGRSPEQWQQDAFGQVDAWLRSLGLRG